MGVSKFFPAEAGIWSAEAILSRRSFFAKAEASAFLRRNSFRRLETGRLRMPEEKR
jgi:hypothetical protein